MLITEAYARENQRLHAVDANYGAEGHLWAYLIAGIASLERCRTVLDYGCGKGSLGRRLAGEIDVAEYDPAVTGKDRSPELPSDLVVCLDVMEHIEPDCLNAVIGDLKRLAGKLLFLVIATKPSKRIMADGRDTHLLQREDAWWSALFESHGFRSVRVWNTGLRQWVALLRAPERP